MDLRNHWFGFKAIDVPLWHHHTLRKITKKVGTVYNVAVEHVVTIVKTSIIWTTVYETRQYNKALNYHVSHKPLAFKDGKAQPVRMNTCFHLHLIILSMFKPSFLITPLHRALAVCSFSLCMSLSKAL